MKVRLALLVIVTMTIFANAPAFATGNHGCRGEQDCSQPQPTPPAPTTTTANPVANGGIGTGYGGQADAASKAKAISDALAQNQNESVQKMWAELSNEQKVKVAAHFNMDANMKDQFSGAVNGFLKNGDSTAKATIKDNVLEGGKAAVGPVAATSGPSTAKSEANGNGAGNITNIGGANYAFPTVPVEGARVSLQVGPQPPNSGVTLWASECMPVFKVDETRKMMALSHSFVGLITTRTENGVVMGTKLSGNEGFQWSPWETIGYKSKKIAITQRTAKGVQALFQVYLAGSSTSSGVNVNKMTEAGAASTGSGIQTFGKEIDLLPCEKTQTREWELVDDQPKAEAPKPEPVAAAKSDAAARLALDKDFMKVPGPVKGHRLVKKPTTCNGQPIPEGMQCVPIRGEIEVLRDVDGRIKVGAGASTEAKVAEAKKP